MKIGKSCMLSFALICLFCCGAWKSYDSQRTGMRYKDAPFIATSADVEVSYTTRNVNADNQTKNGVPKYEPFGNLRNACGSIAGAIAIGFYDKYYPNLIPDYDSYFASSGRYRAQDSIYIPNVINSLYSLMRTNVDGPGVSESEFQNGLESYVNSKGYSINYSSLKINNSFNTTDYKKAVDNNKLAALLVQPGYLYNLGIRNGCDSINEIYISGNHIMIAYGYYEVSYYNGNSLIRSDSYLRVATGQPGVQTALYKIVPSQLDAAYVLNIF